MDIRDLEPKKDPKGGSPKTPLPGTFQPISEGDTGYLWHHPNGNTIWKAVATGLGGLLVGMTVAWFTALQSRGITTEKMEEYVRQSQQDQDKLFVTRTDMQNYVTRPEMHEYTDKYSPWNFDKQSIVGRLSGYDQQIGELRAKIDLAADVIKKQAEQKR